MTPDLRYPASNPPSVMNRTLVSFGAEELDNFREDGAASKLSDTRALEASWRLEGFDDVRCLGGGVISSYVGLAMQTQTQSAREVDVALCSGVGEYEFLASALALPNMVRCCSWSAQTYHAVMICIL